jgi:hypothetical protein
MQARRPGSARSTRPTYPYTLDALLQVLEEARLRSFNEGPQVITVVTGRSSQGEVSRQGQPGLSGERVQVVADRDQVRLNFRLCRRNRLPHRLGCLGEEVLKRLIRCRQPLRKARESLDIFVRVAAQLGMDSIEVELEALAYATMKRNRHARSASSQVAEIASYRQPA